MEAQKVRIASSRVQRHNRFAAAFAAALLLAMTPAWALAQALNNGIEILLKHTDLGGSTVGVYVQDADTGEVLAALNDTRPLIPASNMKLLTTGAALAVLGTDFTFRTELRRAGDTLILKGSGDPALADPDLLAAMELGVEDLIDTWIEAIRKSGEKPPTKVIVDATIFDREFVHPSWPADQLNRWYAAEVAGINFYTNVIAFYLAKDALNQPPRISLEPSTPWLKITNRARSVSQGQNTVWIARPAQSNDMTVYGDLRQTLASPIRVALHDPPAYVGRLLAIRMDYAGLGRPTVETAAPDQALPAGEVISLIQTPITTVITQCNVESHNLYAEALLKRLGHEVTGRPGSFASGAAVLRMVMQDIIGAGDTAPAIITDGSGLSRQNAVTPRALGKWLRALANDPAIADTFMQSLPIAGEDGTLARRFGEKQLASAVRAKSGYIRGVSCLSGYIIHEATGRTLVFSILVNDIPQQRVPISRVKQFHESVVQLADRWLQDNLPVMAGAGEQADDFGG